MSSIWDGLAVIHTNKKASYKESLERNATKPCSICNIGKRVTGSYNCSKCKTKALAELSRRKKEGKEK